jgi:hypothetical protein
VGTGISIIGNALSNASGVYTIGGLATGNYFLFTWGGGGADVRHGHQLPHRGWLGDRAGEPGHGQHRQHEHDGHLQRRAGRDVLRAPARGERPGDEHRVE